MLANEMEFYQSISDPIWGNIGITKVEHDIINTDAFNRLRQIKQMSMAYIGHIGAQHTRYEHSIGCMHVAYNLARNLSFFSHEDREILNEKHYITYPNSSDYQIIRIAALLHDIGHAPLSHLLESAIDKHPFLISDCKSSEFYINANDHDKRAIDNYSHEMFSVRAIYNDAHIQECLNSAAIDHDVIAYLVSGLKLKNISPKYKVYKSLISGDLDADRLDYINRDFYFCGTKQTIDMNLFATTLHYGVDSEMQPTIAVDEASVIHAASFLFSRFMLAQTIHNNQNSRINEQAFIDLVRDYLLSFDKNNRLQKIFELHTSSIDADLFSELNAFDKKYKSEDIAKANNVKKRLNFSPRELTNGKANKEYKPVYSLSWSYLHPFWRYYLSYIIFNKTLMSRIEIKLVKLLGTDDFILDFVTSKPSKMDLSVNRDDGISELITEHNVTIPHALMITAFQSNSLYIYGRSKNSFKIKSLTFKDNEKKDFIYRQVISNQELNKDQSFHLSFLKIIEDVVIKHLLEYKKLPQELYLLFVMYCLKEYIRGELNHTSTIWIKGEGAFQSYLFNNFKSAFSFKEDKEYKYNVDIYVLSEKLVCWGLIDHIHKPIHITNKNNSKYGKTKFSTRIDRNINQWGDLLVDYLYKKAPFAKDELEKIKSKVKETQDSVKDELKNLMSLQLAQKEKNEYMNGTYKIEKEIKGKHGCVIKFV